MENLIKLDEVFYFYPMKLHALQKIGFLGIGIVCLVSLILFLVGHFTVYTFTGLMPFLAALLIGTSVKNSRKRK